MIKIWHLIRIEVQNPKHMYRSYFIIAWRNLLKNKAFSFLNISGLAIGMASALLILLWVENEVSYDLFHKNRDYIYKAWNRGDVSGKLLCWPYTPQVLGPALQKDFPEIQDMARIRGGWFVISTGDNKFSAEFRIVDPSFLRIFSFPLVEGNPATALKGLHSIVLTQKMAKRLFGNEPAMNKMIRIDSTNFTVSGIAKDLPPNTEFSFDYLLNWEMIKRAGWENEYWSNNTCETVLQLKPGADAVALNKKIKDITIRHTEAHDHVEVFLHPISKWHLQSNFVDGKESGGLIDTIRMFTIVAAFILLIACINFMNLSTARSEKRAREVGIRKVSGALRTAIIVQFLGESMFIATISGAIAFIVVQLVLPGFNLLIGKQLSLPLHDPRFWIFSLLFIFITGLMAGSYPAFFLSSFRPVAVLKGQVTKAKALITPRRTLVVLQFTFAIILVISTFVVLRQIRFGQNRQTGYDQSQLVYHYLTGDLGKNYELVKSELLQSGLATTVNRTSSPITQIWGDTWGIEWEGKSPTDRTVFDNLSTDEDLVRTMGLHLVAGRDIDLVKYPTDSTAAILNESAVKAMGFKSPVGKTFNDNGIVWHVVGVVKDFILTSPYYPVNPMAIQGIKSNGMNVINVKLAGGNMPDNIKKFGAIISKYNPEYPYEYHFVDEDYARKFDNGKRTATLSALFAGLTILISCIGLFGLASFVAVQRTKEIGVRKVLGATVMNLWKLLSRDFVVLVLISFCIAVPVAWYFMKEWLLQFDYRTPLSWWIFASAGLGAIAITLMTVSYQAIRAALANPSKSLRTE